MAPFWFRSMTRKSQVDTMLETRPLAATNVLLDQRLFELDEDQHAAFMQALNYPPAPNAKLRELMTEPAPWET